MKTVTDYLLALAMLATGTLNTMSTKGADKQQAKGDTDIPHAFNHPFFQAGGMFIGESLCLAVYGILYYRAKFKGEEPMAAKKGFNPLLFALPALCDLAGTSLMYVGLNMVDPSIFQMIRGSVVIFTGIFSMIFLGRRPYKFQWLGMFLVLIGLCVVGVSSVLSSSASPSPTSAPSISPSPTPGPTVLPTSAPSASPSPILGMSFVVIAQLIAAIQMVVEEKLLGVWEVPALMAVGFEGVFGFAMLAILLVPFYFIPGKNSIIGDNTRIEDSFDAFLMMQQNSLLTGLICLNILSIAFFNFFGVTVTKVMSATTRMVLDSMRTIVIWVLSLAIGWEYWGPYSYIQLIGFFVLITGTFVYNEIPQNILRKNFNVNLPAWLHSEDQEKKTIDYIEEDADYIEKPDDSDKEESAEDYQKLPSTDAPRGSSMQAFRRRYYSRLNVPIKPVDGRLSFARPTSWGF